MVAYLLLAFKVWMLLDVIRRRIHVLWYLVVLAPLGDIVYFFAIKLRDFQTPAAAPRRPLNVSRPRDQTNAAALSIRPQIRAPDAGLARPKKPSTDGEK